MPVQTIINKTESFTEPELILSYLIDNQMISGSDAIILLKSIIENQKKEPEPTLLPRGENTPISTPINPQKHPWEPATTDPSPYNPIKIWYENISDSLSSEYKAFDKKNCTTTTSNTNNINSIASDEVKLEYPTSSTEDIFPFPESKVFNKKD